MDPITRASRLFLADMIAHRRSAHGPVLRLEATFAHRTHLVKTLRLAEFAPDNRRPLFLYEAPFVDAGSYFSGLADTIRRDYEHVRQGAAEEGVTLAAFVLGTPVGTLGPIERAVVHIEQAAMLLGEKLDGLFVALIPSEVPTSGQWSECLAAIARIPWSARVRIAVFDIPDGPATTILGNAGARFALDEQELGTYLKQLGGTPSGGPNRPTPPAVAEAIQGIDDEAATGDGLLARAEAARKLRAFLIGATQRVAGGDYANAATLYHEAIACCRQGGLTLEEAMVRIAFGGMCLTAGITDLAVKSYERAAAIAQAEKVWSLSCQAWLGAGGAHRLRNQHAAAAQAYETAAMMAEYAEMSVLQIEALHLSGRCHLVAGAEDKAVKSWAVALEIGTTLTPEQQRMSTLAEVTTALRELLERRSSREGRVIGRVDRDGMPSDHSPP